MSQTSSQRERKLILDMRPLPRARVKLGGWTRSPRFWWKKPFDPCDPKWPQVDLWLHNIGRGSQANVHVWIVWSCYIQRTSYSIFLWKWHFDPCDPKWPQMNFHTHYFDTEYLADAYAWITQPYHVICRSYSVFGENELLTLVTPYDPGWIFRPITFVQSI